ncbi:hypothetical protein VCHA37P200_60106 [Vibrio chagasii]|nr:hypothetical protein VCHA52P454_130032 [Vibrio chagasii]CAH7320153.1 hypothetical protein VCHA53O468_60106 [Vibrio chagasii]CAH7363255.1 hypothetical protein VCHA55O507_60105 [Vibrio chagasii]CAH7382278.1 hypothetical protein VCHA43P272_80106 [Vibrio chagasii]CAH7451417.1 hypothetical protein VCHA37P200_60106 [Vibrio chagasii]
MINRVSFILSFLIIQNETPLNYI